MDVRCGSASVTGKVKFLDCLSQFKWSGIDNRNRNRMEKNVEEGYIEMGGKDFLSQPTSKTIPVFRFNQWACDRKGVLYLLSQPG
jgi:hypothetical protein